MLSLIYYVDGIPVEREWWADSGDGYPDHQYIKCKGPIPSGVWEVYEQGTNPNVPSHWWPIEGGGTLTCGRDGIYIHGSGSTIGCIAVYGFDDFSDTLKNKAWPDGVLSVSLTVSYPDSAYTYVPHPTCGELKAFKVSPETVDFTLNAGQKGEEDITLKNIDPSLEITGITRPVKKDGPSWISIENPPSSMGAQSEEILTITADPPLGTADGTYEAKFTFEGKIGPYPGCAYTYDTTVSISVEAAVDVSVLVSVPEFSVGGALEMALVLVMIFVWLKKRRKIVRAPVP